MNKIRSIQDQKETKATKKGNQMDGKTAKYF